MEERTQTEFPVLSRNMTEQELCEAVLTRVYGTGTRPGLLDVLAAFEKVRKDSGLSADAAEAVKAYRRLLHWGRLPDPDLWTYYHTDFPIPNPPISRLIRASTSSKPTPTTPRSIRDLVTDFIPTRDNSLNDFIFTLPSFTAFTQRNEQRSIAVADVCRVREM